MAKAKCKYSYVRCMTKKPVANLHAGGVLHSD